MVRKIEIFHPLFVFGDHQYLQLLQSTQGALETTMLLDNPEKSCFLRSKMQTLVLLRTVMSKSDIPKPKMTQYFLDDVKFFDETDDMHLAPAFWTDQRVHFII